MGVKHLQKYIRNGNDVPNGYFEVDIQREIENWKRNNKKPNQQPIIVIDVLGMIDSLYPNMGIPLCGGRHQFIVQKCSDFFSRLTSLGVKLVFFTDGPTQEAKSVTWFERQGNRYSNQMKILDEVYGNVDSQQIVNRHKYKIPTTVDMSALKTACKRFGEFHKPITAECDLEIAKFAYKNTALAVLADDTDFLIFEGNWKYWCSKNLNHSTLKTMEYNKVALRESLGLSVRQMPLFATVGGNDIVRYDTVEQFHRHIGRGNRIFPSIARFVKFKRNYPGHMNDELINQISFEIFGTVNQEQCALIVQSLESYNIRSLQRAEPITDELMSSQLFNDQHGYAYEVLNGITINYTVVFFDFRKSDFKNYFELIERLIVRSMGVLLQHKNDSSLRRKIITKTSHEESYKEMDITPEYPTIEVPALLKLLDDKNVENMNPIRYELLAWIISDKTNGEKLQEIPEIYLPDILVLIYLLENKQISLTEADSVLRTITDAQKNLIPVDIVTPSLIDERAMRFSFLYNKICGLIRRSLGAVGIKKELDTQFDAMYYQMIYNRYLIIPDEDREPLMDDLKDLRLFCLDAL